MYAQNPGKVERAHISNLQMRVNKQQNYWPSYATMELLFLSWTCQISERLEKFKPESRGFETSRDLAVRRLTA